jgi:hypothetical protein
VALAAYTVGVMHRTSFGVAGLDAAERFDAGPAALSGFVVLQLLVYAAFRCPSACSSTGSAGGRWRPHCRSPSPLASSSAPAMR